MKTFPFFLKQGSSTNIIFGIFEYISNDENAGLSTQPYT